MEEELVIQYYADLRKFLNNVKFIKRELEIEEMPNKIISLLGPRRAGKTFYMFGKMIEHIDKSIYFDFEVSLFRELSFKELLKVIKIYEKTFDAHVKYLFLDEIQSLDDWQSIVRSFENMGFNIFISGSSSRLMSKEIATALRGRTLSYVLFPFSFKEFLRAKGFSFKEYYSLEDAVTIIKYLEEYLNYGSFPEVVLREEKEMLLKEYKDLIFFKDFVERFNIEKTRIAKFIFEFLLQNFSKEVSISKIANFVAQKLGETKKNLVYDYVDKLEDTFLFFFVEKYDFSVYERKKWPRKVYVVDTGLTRFFVFKEDKGKLMENVVFLHLKRQENWKPFQKIYFYKTKDKKEIDFLVIDRDKKELIEVCYEYDMMHEKKLFKAMKELNIKQSLCISWDEEKKIEKDGLIINVIPLWKWLLRL